MNKNISCLDCDITIKIKDKYNELVAEDIKYCPICGSSEIEVTED